MHSICFFKIHKRSQRVDSSEKLLKELTEVHGVPGYEHQVQDLLRGYMEPLGKIEQDKLGSLICRLDGEGPKVMLAGHMDEIGFMVRHITKEGFVKFVPLGGWGIRYCWGNG